MKFRDDIDPAKTWVTSDTHFGHENIVGFCFRPDDHEQVMIAQWRQTVPDDATVLHLGDLAYGNSGGRTRFRRLLAKELTGARKLLIMGNHDNQSYSYYRDCGFQIVSPFALHFYTGNGVEQAMEGEGHWNWTVSFSHYAWNPLVEGTMPTTELRVHGHIHNNGYTRAAYVPFLRNHINVSVEQTRYTPVNLQVLLDAALMGRYAVTTEEQEREAQMRHKKHRAEGLKR